MKKARIVSRVERRSRRRRGLTLVEALLALVVLGIAASGVLLPFSAGASVRAEAARRTLAGKLAHDLLEEIINTPFDQIMATYAGYDEPEGQIKDITGAVFSDPVYADYSRCADCQAVYVSQQSGTGQPVFILATVRVYYRGGETARLSRLIGK
jgi:prepilin-type N-terminal cleavage/methylation domain-containing protein